MLEVPLYLEYRNEWCSVSKITKKASKYPSPPLPCLLPFPFRLARSSGRRVVHRSYLWTARITVQEKKKKFWCCPTGIISAEISLLHRDTFLTRKACEKKTNRGWTLVASFRAKPNLPLIHNNTVFSCYIHSKPGTPPELQLLIEEEKKKTRMGRNQRRGGGRSIGLSYLSMILSSSLLEWPDRVVPALLLVLFAF